MSNYTTSIVKDYEKLWFLFLEYHKDVSSYAGEMPLPSEENFLSFWQKEEKWAYFLNNGDDPIGFVLLQLIRENNSVKMEVGAIFVKKEKRGIHSLKLYKLALDCAEDNAVPLTSEIAKDNEHSMSIYKVLEKKFSKKSDLVFSMKEVKQNRVLVSCKCK